MAGTLFDDQHPDPVGPSAAAPLADRMRPTTFEEVVGHEEITGPGGFLRRAMAEERVPSLILWGPPGSGKTTIAQIIAHQISCRFVPFSAVTAGIKEVKQVMAEASLLRGAPVRRTLLFVDEIHRFNRAQQDAFLPYVEGGDILLIGATTENPSFQLNAALMSRCRVVVLSPLGLDDLVLVMERALADGERGLGRLEALVDPDAMETIAQLASGDARKAFNLLEATVHDAVAGGAPNVDAARVHRLAQKKILLYDKSGEEHFNLISALHKSLRESDSDAAIYWLARMLAAGEEPLYLARRLVRFASEDVGLADPQALPQTLAAWDAYHRLGSPEGELALAQATLYLALAPKSNSIYRAYGAAQDAVENRPAEPPPRALRNAPTRLMRDLEYGKGYVYAHDTEEGVGGVECLPEALRGTRFYAPKGEGFEAHLASRLERFRQLREQGRRDR